MIAPALMASVALAAAAPAAPPPSPVRVDAEEAHYDYKERKVTFVGKPLVRLVRDGAVLTCRRLVAENGADGRIQHAVCTGEVKLVRGPRVATCDVATYDDGAGRVVCVGNPVLRDGASVMRGEELVYDLEDDRVTLSRARGTVVPRPEDTPAKRRKGEAP